MEAIRRTTETMYVSETRENFRQRVQEFIQLWARILKYTQRLKVWCIFLP